MHALPQFELPDDFPHEFVPAWHEAGHVVAEAIQQSLVDIVEDEDVRKMEGDGVAFPADLLLTSAGAMAFCMGVLWAREHPNASVEMPEIDSVVKILAVHHLMDNQPG